MLILSMNDLEFKDSSNVVYKTRLTKFTFGCSQVVFNIYNFIRLFI